MGVTSVTFTNIAKCNCGMGDASAGLHADWCPMYCRPSQPVGEKVLCDHGYDFDSLRTEAVICTPACHFEAEAHISSTAKRTHTAHLEARVKELKAQLQKADFCACTWDDGGMPVSLCDAHNTRVAELEGALGNARGLLRRAVQSHMIRDLLGEFWVDDVSLWLNSKPVQSLDATRAALKEGVK